MRLIVALSRSDVVLVAAREEGPQEDRGVREALGADDALQDGVGLALVVVGRAVVVDDARAVDEVDALRQRDVLPDLGLPRDGRDLADGLGPQGVDHARLADVGVADDAHADLLGLAVELGVLAEDVE